jgi:DNA-directed RNA polymerase specialized sigma24 family protein
MDTALAGTPTVDLNVAELYRSLASQLARIVKLDTEAPDPVVEDACQTAWDRLIGEAPAPRRECALSWLVTTAVREANRLAHRDDREPPVSEAGAALMTRDHGVAAAPCDDVVQRREQLTLVRHLPERQQRLLWLQALGLSYDEMAVYTGCTRRTVERQLLRGRQRLRAMAADAAV